MGTFAPSHVAFQPKPFNRPLIGSQKSDFFIPGKPGDEIMQPLFQGQRRVLKGVFVTH
jgi:hypothetical protein